MDNSKILLKNALEILKEASIDIDQWAIGGGTVLAYYYNHRLSKDIDIFIDDVQFLSKVSPRFNDNADEAIDYDETGNYVSLTYPEGKIDFIAGTQISKFHPKKQYFLGQNVYLEDAVEIVSKKIYYRGTYVKPRDIFDLAVVSNSDRHNDLVVTLKNISPQTNSFFEKFKNVKKSTTYTVYSNKFKDSILEGGRKFINNEVFLVDKLGSELKAKGILKTNYLQR